MNSILIDVQQVVEIQKRKKLLAKVTFGQDPVSETEFGILQVFFISYFLITRLICV
jgi:hypothetical protein